MLRTLLVLLPEEILLSTKGRRTNYVFESSVDVETFLERVRPKISWIRCCLMKTFQWICVDTKQILWNLLKVRVKTNIFDKIFYILFGDIYIEINHNSFEFYWIFEYFLSNRNIEKYV